MATQGRPLSPDFKRAIVLVKDYFDRIKGDLREQDGSSAERTAHALGVGLATVKRVMADSKRSPAGLIQEESIRRGRPPRVLSDSLQTITREYVRQANREGSHLTLEMLSEYLKEDGSAPNFSVRTLGRALDRWGFTFGKGTRSQHLKEKDHVVAARYRYLRAKRGNRKGDNVIRPEVYLLPIRSINFPYSEFQAGGRDEYPTPAVAGWLPAPLTRASFAAGFPLRQQTV